jgi:predicted deacylase
VSCTRAGSIDEVSARVATPAPFSTKEWQGLGAVPLNSKMVFHHRVSDQTDAALAMPIFCVRGVNDGPTLLVLAGVHGDEFEPLVAAQDMLESLDPATMSGTWLCVVSGRVVLRIQ